MDKLSKAFVAFRDADLQTAALEGYKRAVVEAAPSDRAAAAAVLAQKSTEAKEAREAALRMAYALPDGLRSKLTSMLEYSRRKDAA